MTPQGSEGGNFDVNACEALFNSASDFLSKLLKISPLPGAEIAGGADTQKSNAWTFLPRGHVKLGGAGSENGVSTGAFNKKLIGLHEKLETLKGKKNADYKDRVMKNSLKKKITKKERKQAYKKLQTIRSQEPGAIFIPKSEEDKKEVKFVPPKPPKPVFNSEGKMVFSKFGFDESTSMSSDLRGKKFYDPKALLHKLQKENESMKTLEMTGDVEKVKAAKEEQAWKKAFQLADGVKVKDDPARLAKAAKKIKQRKAKHQKQWEERKEAVDKKMNLKSQKRQDNISDRQKRVKNNKLRKSAKRGRVIPGF